MAQLTIHFWANISTLRISITTFPNYFMTDPRVLLCAPNIIIDTPTKIAKFHFLTFVKLIWIGKFISPIRIDQSINDFLKTKFKNMFYELI